MTAAIAEQTREIRIPAPAMERLKVTIKGISSLICKRMDEEAADAVEAKQTRTGGKQKKPLDPKKEWMLARYLNEDSEDCIPVGGIKNAMVSAASKDVGIFKTSVKSAITVTSEDGGDLVLLKHDRKEPICRRDMLPSQGHKGGGRVPRYRPEYKSWSATFLIDFDADMIGAQEVLNLLARAGVGVGLHEHRPLGKYSTGPHGRFVVDLQSAALSKVA